MVGRLFPLIKYVNSPVSEACSVLISISQFEDDLDDLIPSFDRSGGDTDTYPVLLIVFNNVLLISAERVQNLFLPVIEHPSDTDQFFDAGPQTLVYDDIQFFPLLFGRIVFGIEHHVVLFDVVSRLKIRIDVKHHVEFVRVRDLITEVVVLLHVMKLIIVCIYEQKMTLVFQEIVFIRFLIVTVMPKRLQTDVVQGSADILDDMEGIDTDGSVWEAVTDHIFVILIHIDGYVSYGISLFPRDLTEVIPQFSFFPAFKDVDDIAFVQAEDHQSVLVFGFAGEVEFIDRDTCGKRIPGDLHMFIEYRYDFIYGQTDFPGNRPESLVIVFRKLQYISDRLIRYMTVLGRERIIFIESLSAVRAEESPGTVVNKSLFIQEDRMPDDLRPVLFDIFGKSSTGWASAASVDKCDTEMMDTGFQFFGTYFNIGIFEAEKRSDRIRHR